MKYNIFLIFLFTFILLGTVLKTAQNTNVAHEFTIKTERKYFDLGIGNFTNWKNWLVWSDYPYPALVAPNKTSAKITTPGNKDKYSLYLTDNSDGYTITFNSEPVSLTGYCNFAISGAYATKTITAQCNQKHIETGSGTSSAAPLPIDIPASMERLKLYLQSLND